MNAAQQLEAAAQYGSQSRREESATAPCQDHRVMDMIKGRNFETPLGEADTISILKAWNEAFNAEHIRLVF